MTLGERLTWLRNQKGMSQDALAEALGVSRQSVSKWETDASIPELDKLIRLSDLFEISLDELARGGASPVTRPVQEPRVHIWLRRLTDLYRGKAHLLGWLLAAWGLMGLIRSVQTTASFYAEFGWEGTENALRVMSYFYLSHLFKIVIGTLIPLWGRRFSGRFRWYHLGWVLVILGVFGCSRVRFLGTGLLEDLLAVFLLYLPYYGPAKTREFLALWPDSPGSLLVCMLGLWVVIRGGRTAKHENPPE